MNERPVAQRALPNDLPAERLRLRPDIDGGLTVDPSTARWRYLSLRVVTLGSGEALEVGLAGGETVAVVLGGGGVGATLPDGRRHDLEGRSSVFDGLPWALYLPTGRTATLTGVPARPEGRTSVAIASAPASRAPDPAQPERVISPADIAVEVRGAGNATRQINHIITPDFPADRLEVVEVFTPSGNWSSWPPHKHDVDDMPREAVLEEIYLYQFARPEGWGIQRLYRRDGTRDAAWAVRHGEAILVTDGYHPFVAAHGFDAYYLNALAGDRRTMACTDDPDLAWTRAAWATLEPDPRVPLVPPRS